jgi:hypothetical protein
MTERNNYRKYLNINKEHTTYGGKIYTQDFECKAFLSDYADRIASDFIFDNDCRKNCLARERRKYKGDFKICL